MNRWKPRQNTCPIWSALRIPTRQGWPPSLAWARSRRLSMARQSVTTEQIWLFIADAAHSPLSPEQVIEHLTLACDARSSIWPIVSGAASRPPMMRSHSRTWKRSRGRSTSYKRGASHDPARAIEASQAGASADHQYPTYDELRQWCAMLLLWEVHHGLGKHHGSHPTSPRDELPLHRDHSLSPGGLI